MQLCSAHETQEHGYAEGGAMFLMETTTTATSTSTANAAANASVHTAWAQQATL